MINTSKQNKNGSVYSYLRFSSEPQSWGDSERRQSQMALDWCRRNGQNLSENRFADRGVSGWKGKNRTSGALGQLLRVVAPGDTILLEDIDRFSRESPLDSLNALRAAVDKGVDIIFLKTGVKVTASNFNDPATLFPAFFGSFLANSENEKKSFRVREAIAARRAKLEKGIDVAGRCPCWLDWDATAEKHIVNEQKAKVVRRMFDLCNSGIGTRAIERKLREEGYKPITARVTYKKLPVSWSKTTIQRILTSKTVLGFVHADAKVRVYPAIVTDDVFYAAQQKLQGRKTFTVRNDCQDNNLFTGLCVCGYCGSSYVRLTARKDYVYLACSGSLRHTTACKGLGQLHYRKFEESFLNLLAQTDLIRGILNGKQEPSILDALRGELSDVQKQCEKYLRLIEGDENPSRRLMDNLKALESKESDLQKEVEAAEAKERGTTPASRVYADLKGEFEALTTNPENRQRLREALRGLVEKIEVMRDSDVKQYRVFLRQASQPITVTLHPTDGWLFNPAPGWVVSK